MLKMVSRKVINYCFVSLLNLTIKLGMFGVVLCPISIALLLSFFFFGSTLSVSCKFLPLKKVN